MGDRGGGIGVSEGMAKNREKIEVLNRAALWCLHNRTGKKAVTRFGITRKRKVDKATKVTPDEELSLDIQSFVNKSQCKSQTLSGK